MSDTRVLVLVGSLRADSLNRKLAETLQAQAPAGVTFEIAEGLDELPFYNEDLDGETVPVAAAPCAPRSPARTGCWPSPPSTTAPCRPCSTTPSTGCRARTGPGAIKGKPFGVVGATPTPYGGKWAHADARRSAGIAGAHVVEDATVSQSALEVDVLTDPEVLGRLGDAVEALVARRRGTTPRA